MKLKKRITAIALAGIICCISHSFAAKVLISNVDVETFGSGQSGFSYGMCHLYIEPTSGKPISIPIPAPEGYKGAETYKGTTHEIPDGDYKTVNMSLICQDKNAGYRSNRSNPNSFGGCLANVQGYARQFTMKLEQADVLVVSITKEPHEKCSLVNGAELEKK